MLSNTLLNCEAKYLMKWLELDLSVKETRHHTRVDNFAKYWSVFNIFHCTTRQTICYKTIITCPIIIAAFACETIVFQNRINSKIQYYYVSIESFTNSSKIKIYRSKCVKRTRVQ